MFLQKKFTKRELYRLLLKLWEVNTFNKEYKFLKIMPGENMLL